MLQVLIAGTAELLGEALVLGEAAGIDRATLLEVIDASAIASPFVGYKSEPLLRDDYSATFTTALMLKDVELVLDLAAESDLTLPFARHSGCCSSRGGGRPRRRRLHGARPQLGTPPAEPQIATGRGDER